MVVPKLPVDVLRMFGSHSYPLCLLHVVPMPAWEQRKLGELALTYSGGTPALAILLTMEAKFLLSDLLKSIAIQPNCHLRLRV